MQRAKPCHDIPAAGRLSSELDFHSKDAYARSMLIYRLVISKMKFSSLNLRPLFHICQRVEHDLHQD
jgi:hypothetical protein